MKTRVCLNYLVNDCTLGDKCFSVFIYVKEIAYVNSDIAPKFIKIGYTFSQILNLKF